MDQTLRLGWTRGRVAARRTVFRRALGVNLALQAAIAITAILAPQWVAGLLGFDKFTLVGWMGAWGGMMLLIAALQIPGLVEPVRARWAVIVGIVGRGALVLIYLTLAIGAGVGFLWLALFELVFAALLATLYQALGSAEIMSRP